MLNQNNLNKQVKLDVIDGVSALAAKGEAVSALLTIVHESNELSKPSAEVVANASWAVTDYFREIRTQLR